MDVGEYGIVGHILTLCCVIVADLLLDPQSVTLLSKVTPESDKRHFITFAIFAQQISSTIVIMEGLT